MTATPPHSPRLFGRGVLLALIAINLVTYSFQTLRRTHFVDYATFYTAGYISRTAPEMLYDREYQQDLEPKLLHDPVFLPFFHPPLEVPLFAELSRLPLRKSLNTWRLLSVLLLIASGYLLGAALERDRVETILLGCALFPMAYCISLGQDTMLLLFLITAAFYFLKKGSDLLAGVVLSFTLFKPELTVILAIALLASGWLRFIVSFAISSAIVTAASLSYMGRSGIRRILDCMKWSEQHAPTFAMPNLRGVIARVASDHDKLALVVLLCVLAAFVPLWRRARRLDFAVATAICLVDTVGLHLFAYDLALLLLPVVILCSTFQKSDTRVIALLTSAPLCLVLFTFNLSCLLIVPTMLLLAGCFRLREPLTAPTLVGATFS